jgi:hypothetical protein
MADQAGTQLPGNQAAPASTVPKAKVASWYTRFVYPILAFVFIVVSLIRVYNFFFPSLPSCDGSVARDTLSDIFKRDNLQASSYEQVKTLTTSKDELTCSASLKMSDGAIMEIVYRIYWQGKDAYVAIASKALNRDQK